MVSELMTDSAKQFIIVRAWFPMVKLLLALHDAGYLADSGSYWTWHSPILSTRLLDDFFYTFAQPARKQLGPRLEVENIYGGVVRCDNMYTFVYRLLSGGRDQSGRLDRAILIVGVVLDASPSLRELFNMLRGELFERIARNTDDFPIAAIMPLEFELPEATEGGQQSLVPIRGLESTVEEEFDLQSTFDEAIRRCEMCSHEIWECRVVLENGSGKGWLKTKSRVTEPIKPPALPVSKPADEGGVWSAPPVGKKTIGRQPIGRIVRRRMARMLKRFIAVGWTSAFCGLVVGFVLGLICGAWW